MARRYSDAEQKDGNRAIWRVKDGKHTTTTSTTTTTKSKNKPVLRNSRRLLDGTRREKVPEDVIRVHIKGKMMIKMMVVAPDTKYLQE